MDTKNFIIHQKIYFASECTDKGGSPKGKCAAGFGICCVFTLTGDDSTQTVNYNDTYFSYRIVLSCQLCYSALVQLKSTWP